MSITDIWDFIQKNGAGAVMLLALVCGLIEITPVKLNPWSKIAGWFGRAVNKDVLAKLVEVKAHQEETRKELDKHITMDDQRDADLHRYRILRFNTEILRNIRHTKEEFDEILYNIKCYEIFCKTHENYQNNRAVLAIENIERVYKERMERRDFLEYEEGKP